MVIKKLGPIFLLALVSALILGVLNRSTYLLIEQNETHYLMKNFKQIGIAFDNKLLATKRALLVDQISSLSDVYVYEAYLGTQYKGVFLSGSVIGYGGAIVFLVGFNQKDQVIGVRVITHQETPGLGDKIEAEKSDWVLQFNDQNIDLARWKVLKQGGDFDQITSATITTQAMLEGIKQMIDLYKQFKQGGQL